MNQTGRKILLLALVLCLLLSGCELGRLTRSGVLTPYSMMRYARPDMVALRDALEKSCQAATEETDIKRLEDAIWVFFDAYDDFYTNFSLAMIENSKDLTDSYWSAEYAYCAQNSAAVDAGLDRFYRCLAQSPLRETLETEAYFGPDYFDSYEGQSIYDEHMTQLLSKEMLLCAQYQSLCGEAGDTAYYSEEFFNSYGSQMAEVFLQMVQLRQEISAYAGYDSYSQFAYDFYFARDYTPQEATDYLSAIQRELTPLYENVFSQPERESPVWTVTETDTLQYVQSMAKNMGGRIYDAFRGMQKAGVYDISHRDNKYPVSFEIYLYKYYTPYIFLCPTGSNYDMLNFAHEFGHFCTDFSTPGGSMHNADVAEIFSQGMEYLSLFYAKGGDKLTRLRMESSLSAYVEQAAYASFEHRVYDLPGEELTVERIEALYAEICSAYGLNTRTWDSRDYVCIPHFF